MSLIYLDTETTGLDPDRHEIWEVAYAIGDGPIECSFVDHDLATPTADPAALEIGRYAERIPDMLMLRRSDVRDFETRLKVAVTGATIVGANPAFDAAMLRARWRSAPWHYRLFDIEAYAMPALDLTEPRGLAYICEQLDISPPNHSAAEDVRALRDCHRALVVLYSVVDW